MKEANDNGINVVPQLSLDESHVVDNINARFVLKNTINEDENPDLIIRQSDQDLLMINKKRLDMDSLLILTDEVDDYDFFEQLDESELSSPSFSELQSTECTKVGKKCIKFMSYGQL